MREGEKVPEKERGHTERVVERKAVAGAVGELGCEIQKRKHLNGI